MPRAARSAEAVDAEKRRILKAASKIICEQGFEKFSMRKLAFEVGMTATNIYNYFSGKDELYLEIQKQGFEMLADDLLQVVLGMTDPLEKIRSMMKAYVDFGIKNSDIYDIIFSWNTPKFADYRGTGMEPAARMEKDAGLKVLAFAEDVLKELIKSENHILNKDEIHFRAMQVWTSLHGAVNLCNSRVLQEVTEDIDGYIHRYIEELLVFDKSFGRGE